eukprot:364747-Chlamydomonas_euryale.AAC.17
MAAGSALLDPHLTAALEGPGRARNVSDKQARPCKLQTCVFSCKIRRLLRTFVFHHWSRCHISQQSLSSIDTAPQTGHATRTGHAT